MNAATNDGLVSHTFFSFLQHLYIGVIVREGRVERFLLIEHCFFYGCTRVYAYDIAEPGCVTIHTTHHTSPHHPPSSSTSSPTAISSERNLICCCEEKDELGVLMEKSRQKESNDMVSDGVYKEPPFCTESLLVWFVSLHRIAVKDRCSCC